MRTTLVQALRGRTPLRPQDILRSGLGALLGIPVTGLLAHLIASGKASALPLLIPPIGASAVLAFAVPASPLAQPRSIIGGNMVSARAETMLPPMIDRGWARGLAGTAKASTAEAPIGGISSGRAEAFPLAIRWASRPVTGMPSSAPRPERRMSCGRRGVRPRRAWTRVVRIGARNQSRSPDRRES